MIVGGHSHTFIGSVPWSEGPYPTIALDLDDVEVPIVTNGKWGFNLGHLQIEFNEQGRVQSYSGQPIQLLEDTVSQDAKLEKKILAWKQPFLDFASEVVGYAKGAFAQMTCQITECSVGNLVADAMLAAHPKADIAMVNAGGLRAGISSGNITRGEVLTVLPFGSTLVDLTFTGQELWNILEGIVSWQNLETGHEITSFAQIAGARIVYDGSRARGSRLSSIKIRSHVSDEYEELVLSDTYIVCTLDFMVTGGDFWWPEKKGFTQTEKVDDVVIIYLGSHSPVRPILDGRIRDKSIKGSVKAHAETLLKLPHMVFEMWIATFGQFESRGLHVFEWMAIQTIRDRI